MLTIELNMYHAVALGAFLFWLGGVITDKVSLLSRYCIPAPLVGGLCFPSSTAFSILLLRGLQRHGPQLRRGGHDCGLYRLRHGRNLERHGQHAGRDEEIRSFAGGVLCHPDGRRHVH